MEIIYLFELPENVFNLLPLPQKNFIKLLEPFIKKINKEFVDDKSGFAFDDNSQTLNLDIIPKEFPDAELNIMFSKEQFILSFAESEQIECHSADCIGDSLFNDTLKLLEKYLNGFLIKDYFNQKGKLIHREYYSKDNELISGMSYSFFFRNTSRKIIRKEKYFSETQRNIKFYL